MTDKRDDKQKWVDEQILSRVQRGIELLQEKHGRDWVDKIDLETLDLSSGAHCVLGQVYATEAERNTEEGYDDDDGYLYGLRVLGFEDEDSEGDDAYGFCTDGNDSYRELQKTWVDEILKRKRPVFKS